jgi:hypothetical protein
MFYLSQYFDTHRLVYIARLRNLNGVKSWNAWVAFFLEALATQAETNAAKARGILALYERLKVQAIALTRSEFAVPLLDRLFAQPVLASNALFGGANLPTKPVITKLLNQLRDAGILKQLRASRGRRAQVLALHELVNLCEGKKVI